MKLNFGKYRNKTVEELPTDYLIWVRRTKGKYLNKELRTELEEEIKKRALELYEKEKLGNH